MLQRWLQQAHDNHRMFSSARIRTHTTLALPRLGHHASYAQVRVPKEETGMVSDLRYGWKKLRKLGTEVSDNLARLQVRD